MAGRHMLLWPDLHKLILRHEAHWPAGCQVDAGVAVMHAAVGRTRRRHLRRASAQVQRVFEPSGLERTGRSAVR